MMTGDQRKLHCGFDLIATLSILRMLIAGYKYTETCEKYGKYQLSLGEKKRDIETFTWRGKKEIK